MKAPNPKPYTLRPEPYTLHPTPDEGGRTQGLLTLNPTPYTLHLTREDAKAPVPAAASSWISSVKGFTSSCQSSCKIQASARGGEEVRDLRFRLLQEEETRFVI
jgi:hypothetical protein